MKLFDTVNKSVRGVRRTASKSAAYSTKSKNAAAPARQNAALTVFAALALMLAAALIFTGCKQPAAPEPTPAPPAYTTVAYAKLAEYLQKLPEGTATHYIEVTGLKKEHLNGNNGSNSLKSILHVDLNKKVALKLPKTVEGLTDMTACFLECENLVSVANIPSGVREMKDCFYGCIRLKTAPVIPLGVLSMSYCFFGCKNLTSVTLKCGCIPDWFEDTFKDCNALGVGSIKVPKAAYNRFTTAEALNKMAVPGADEAEKRAKFKGLAELNP